MASKCHYQTASKFKENLAIDSRHYVDTTLTLCWHYVDTTLTLRWQDFGFFDHLPPCVKIFYGINVDKKWSNLDHLPTLSCKHSLWTTPCEKHAINHYFTKHHSKEEPSLKPTFLFFSFLVMSVCKNESKFQMLLSYWPTINFWFIFTNWHQEKETFKPVTSLVPHLRIHYLLT